MLDTRDPVCVKRWPECESGAYDPRCCRFPKSCSCTSEQMPEIARSHSLAVLRASIWEVAQFLSPVELRRYIKDVLDELTSHED